MLIATSSFNTACESRQPKRLFVVAHEVTLAPVAPDHIAAGGSCKQTVAIPAREMIVSVSLAGERNQGTAPSALVTHWVPPPQFAVTRALLIPGKVRHHFAANIRISGGRSAAVLKQAVRGRPTKPWAGAPGGYDSHPIIADSIACPAAAGHENACLCG